METSRPTAGTLLLAGAAVAVAFVYFVMVPRHVLAGDRSRALLYLVVGWVPYTVLFYAIGRLFTTPSALPQMRAADAGLGLFLVSVLLSVGLEAWGFSPERIPVGHVPQAIGIFLGLALFGWGIGRRSSAVARAD